MNKRRDWIQVIIVGVAFTVFSYVTNPDWLSIVASISGLLCVWLAAKENIWSYPIGFVNVIGFFIIFKDAKLYADMTLQVIFGLLMVIGWVTWLTKRGNEKVRPTRKLSKKEWYLYSLGVIVVSLLWGWGLEKFTDASIPYLDAFIATLSIYAQWLLSRKIFENWYVWIFIDVLSIGMYMYKGLDIISFTYFVFLLNAVFGLYSWKKTYNKEKEVLLKSKLSM